MTEESPIAVEIKNLRDQYLQKREGKTDLVATWVEETPLISKRELPVLAHVMILATRGCKWALSGSGGCSMCGYINDSSREELTQSLILKQFSKALNQQLHHNERIIQIVKIFNSGSFFDDEEVHPKTRDQIFRQLDQYPDLQEVAVESRPEYINEEKIDSVLNILGDKKLVIGIGLETSSDYIRNNCINKGFSFNDFKKATSLIIDREALVKAYLLLKPPFLTEIEALWDTLRSVRVLTDLGIPAISLNPCTVQNGTLVEKLFLKGQYRPPWLWTVLESLKTSIQKFPQSKILCEPTGAGSQRGPRNCGKCDKTIANLIKKISLHQRVDIEEPSCQCKNIWKETINLDDSLQKIFLGLNSIPKLY
ncbi:MAG: archaeosine biosynthesis radical SAM protein RaSEA [Candidatus Hodarchaeota archaeon]